jgi:shikimate dehydrogenase
MSRPMSTQDPPAEQRRVGIIGWPVEHSVSPAMHNAAFEALGLTWRYERLPTEPDDLLQRVAALREATFAGANVTIPHKEAVIPALDHVVADAAAIGAVNTIVSREALLTGHNTDVAGIRWAMRQHHVAPARWHAVVLGAGGAARAALYALYLEDAASVSIFNRTPERAERLADSLRLGELDVATHALDDGQQLQAELARADLLVNSTSVGMWPASNASPLPEGVDLPRHLVVFDMVYNPQHTRLLQYADRAGARTIDGLDMLVGQGAESFQLWTGRTPPVDLMQQAALAWLEQHK